MIDQPLPDSQTQVKPRLADDLLDGADAAAKFIGISRRQVYRLTADGELPVIRMCQRRLYRKSDLYATFGGEMQPQAERPKQEPASPDGPERLALTMGGTRTPPSDPRPTLADLYPLFAELFEPKPERMSATM